MEGADRPAIILVDDEIEVVRSVERDMRRRYSSQYRVMAVTSGSEALDTVDRLALRGDHLALVVADQRMPSMSGTQLLEQVAERSPQTRRVLLTAYADTDAAIEAINLAGVDYYILKPWDPPEERLYPVIDDLLEEWQAVGRPPRQGGLRIVGDRWSAESHELREFLARNQVPFRWLEVDRSAEADRLVASMSDPRLPMAILEDGTVLGHASPRSVAQAVGMQPSTSSEFHDLIVVGAGPAGLAAAVYGASEGLTTTVVEAEAPGGQAGTSSRIENYLGFPQGVSGADLSRRALTQARRFGATFIAPRRVTGLRRDDPYRILTLDDGEELRSSAVIIATGVHYRELTVPGAKELRGRGVYYGSASTEAHGLSGEHVVVVGGANSAGQAAVHLSRFAEKVTIVVRAESLTKRMSSYLVDQIASIGSISVLPETEISQFHGTDHLEGITISKPSGTERIDAAAAFVFIGSRPRTDWLEGMVARDTGGFLKTGTDLSDIGRWGLDRDPMLLETSVPGVFAVGDVRSLSVKRVASAVGEGSVAVHLVHAYLAG